MKMINVKSLASKNIVSINMRHSLGEAYKIMRAAQVRHLPVINEQGNVVGIMSDRDFQRSMWPFDWSKSDYNPETVVFSEEPVSDYMTWPVKSVEGSATVAEVAHIFLRDKISALLVVNNEDLIGIVTTTDLLKELIQLLNAEKSFKDKTKEWAYNSPIGAWIQTLANAGI